MSILPGRLHFQVGAFLNATSSIHRHSTNRPSVGGPFVYPGCTYQELNWDASVDCPYF